MEKFKLESRSITEVQSEVYSDNYQIIYSFNYVDGEIPRAISFSFSTKTEPNERLITGSYLSGINQLDFKVTKSVDNLGTIIDHITASCKSIIHQNEDVS